MTHRELKKKRRELFNVEKCARKSLWSDELKESRLLELSMALLSSYDEEISSSLHFKRKKRVVAHKNHPGNIISSGEDQQRRAAKSSFPFSSLAAFFV